MIKILLIAGLGVIAWHYGIIAWGLRTTLEIAMAVFNMLKDLVDMMSSFQSLLQNALTNKP